MTATTSPSPAVTALRHSSVPACSCWLPVLAWFWPGAALVDGVGTGLTHLGVALLHGDLAGAWTANPFVFVLLAGLVIACVFWTVELAGGPAVRLRGRLADQRLWYAVLGVAAIVFAVVRNL